MQTKLLYLFVIPLISASIAVETFFTRVPRELAADDKFVDVCCDGECQFCNFKLPCKVGVSNQYLLYILTKCSLIAARNTPVVWE